MSASERLERRKARYLEALLAEPTLDSAARAAGISVATGRRWRSEPTFARAWREEGIKAHEEATTQLLTAKSKAVGTLVALLEPSYTGQVRVGAAKALLAAGQMINAFEVADAYQDPADDEAACEAVMDYVERWVAERARRSEPPPPDRVVGVDTNLVLTDDGHRTAIDSGTDVRSEYDGRTLPVGHAQAEDGGGGVP